MSSAAGTIMRPVSVMAVVLVTVMVAAVALAQNTRPPENAENVAAGKAIYGRMGLKSFKRHSHLTSAAKNAICLQCHKNFSYLGAWSGSTHDSQNVACVDCHRIMVKVSEDKALVKEKQMDVCFQCHPQKKAQMSRTFHMPIREGKIVCTNCHNPHGGKGSPLLKEASVNEICYQCHADRRGPMLWEHPPVRENCANCHDPHGTNYPRLLKIKAPYLCQTCHSAALHSSEILDARRGVRGVRPSSRLLGKYCVNCHSRIHGSNHPSGARFQR